MKNFCQWWDSFKKRINELPKTNVFLYGVVILLCIGFVLSICKINHLNSRLDTQNTLIIQIFRGDKETEQNLKLQKFKEDFYIKQQERDSNLILTVLPILFAIFGILSYKLSSDEFSFFKTQQKNKHAKQQAKYNSTHKQLVETQNDLYYQIADINMNKADNHLNDENKASYLFYKIVALKSYTTCYFNHVELKQEDTAKSLLNDMIIPHLKDIESISDLTAIHKSVIINSLKYIGSINNTEIDDLLPKIQVKIKYE